MWKTFRATIVSVYRDKDKALHTTSHAFTEVYEEPSDNPLPSAMAELYDQLTLDETVEELSIVIKVTR